MVSVNAYSTLAYSSLGIFPSVHVVSIWSEPSAVRIILFMHKRQWNQSGQ